MGKMQIFLPGQPINMRGRQPVASAPQRENKCPDWLFQLYRKNVPVYRYRNGNFALKFLSVERNPELKSYVGIYFTNVQGADDPRQQWNHKFFWIFRNGVWTEIRREGETVFNPVHIGWANA